MLAYQWLLQYLRYDDESAMATSDAGARTLVLPVHLFLQELYTVSSLIIWNCVIGDRRVFIKWRRSL